MRRSFLAGAAVLVLAASPSLASEFQDLRSSSEAVERAFSSLPSQQVTGSLNRLDAIERQSPNPTTQRRLVDALTDLETQLRTGLPSLDARDRLVVAQVVQGLVIEDFLPADDDTAAPCADGLFEWGGECHGAVEYRLDRISSLLESSIREGFAQFAADHPDLPVPSAPPASAGVMDAQAFGGWLDDVVQGPGAITGTEQIDVE